MSGHRRRSVFFHSGESIYAASTADSSFYESFDPFEYMTAQAQRHEEINTEFQEFQELQQQPVPGTAAATGGNTSTPARQQHAQKQELASPETDSMPTPIRNALIKKVIINRRWQKMRVQQLDDGCHVLNCAGSTPLLSTLLPLPRPIWAKRQLAIANLLSLHSSASSHG